MYCTSKNNNFISTQKGELKWGFDDKLVNSHSSLIDELSYAAYQGDDNLISSKISMSSFLIFFVSLLLFLLLLLVIVFFNKKYRPSTRV